MPLPSLYVNAWEGNDQLTAFLFLRLCLILR